MGELARESARRASTRNFSGVAATSSPRGGAPAAEEPQHTGTMTLDQVRAIRQQAAPDQDLEHLEVCVDAAVPCASRRAGCSRPWLWWRLRFGGGRCCCRGKSSFVCSA